MSWNRWAEKQALRLELVELAGALATVKHEFANVSSDSSSLLSYRIHQASSDYWKACKAYEQDMLDRTRRLLEAARIEVGFIKQLLQAECAERELGEAVYFEYADKKDARSSLERIEKSLDAIGVELDALSNACRRARRC